MDGRDKLCLIVELNVSAVIIFARDRARKTAAAINGARELNTYRVTDPPGEISRPGQRAVNSRRRHFECVSLRNGVCRLKYRGHSTREARAILDTGWRAPCPFCHDLQVRAASTLNAQAHDFHAEALSHRLDQGEKTAFLFSQNDHV
jgi:hypothetical protein